MLKQLNPRICVASLVKLERPDPPTPISNELPLFYLKVLINLDKCLIASKKKTRFIVFGIYVLYISI